VRPTYRKGGRVHGGTGALGEGRWAVARATPRIRRARGRPTVPELPALPEPVGRPRPRRWKGRRPNAFPGPVVGPPRPGRWARPSPRIHSGPGRVDPQPLAPAPKAAPAPTRRVCDHAAEQ